jgi:CRP/FNR family transcriptional regulator
MNDSLHGLHTAQGSETTSNNDRYASALECLIGGSVAEWAPGGVSPFALLRVAEHHPLFHEGSPTHSVHVVQAGFFKIVRTGEDGYEHVLDFAGRHDLLGCDGLANGQHPSSAVALEESWVYALPMAEVRRLTQRLPGFSAHWESAMSAQIGRAGDLAWLMAAVGAEKRTARFISLYARRMAERGQSSRRLLLRMSRRDIASHLGLAHESVSRSFTLLAEAGVLLVDNREVEIVDPDALHRYAFSTRGYPPAVPRQPAAVTGEARRPDLRVVACA